MPDEAEKPPDHPTKQLSANDILNARLDQIFQSTVACRDSTEACRGEVRTVRADLALVAGDLVTLKDRVALVESRQNDFDSRATRTSIRIRDQSNTDLTHEAQLAAEKTARETLARDQSALAVKVDTIAQVQRDLVETNRLQTEILQRLAQVTSNPTFKAVAHAVGVAILTWFAARGLK